VRRALEWYERPFAWWRRHAWTPVWIAVVLTPAALLALRLIDDTTVALLVPSALVLTVLLFLAIVGTAVRTSARRSLPRALVGGGGAVLAAALLALPMTHVIGQRACPEHMGPDRGVQVTTQMFDAWRKAAPPPADIWTSAAVADAWKARVDKLALVDYKLVESGCWERLAPVTTGQTWHEFRVTVRRGDGDRFSKIVTVYTRAARDGWAIAEIEGLER
jgi:hypothetical protein